MFQTSLGSLTGLLCFFFFMGIIVMPLAWTPPNRYFGAIAAIVTGVVDTFQTLWFKSLAQSFGKTTEQAIKDWEIMRTCYIGWMLRRNLLIQLTWMRGYMKWWMHPIFLVYALFGGCKNKQNKLRAWEESHVSRKQAAEFTRPVENGVNPMQTHFDWARPLIDNDVSDEDLLTLLSNITDVKNRELDTDKDRFVGTLHRHGVLQTWLPGSEKWWSMWLIENVEEPDRHYCRIYDFGFEPYEPDDCIELEIPAHRLAAVFATLGVDCYNLDVFLK